MEKAKKISIILIAALIVCTLAVVMVACNGNSQPSDPGTTGGTETPEPPHQHVAGKWVSDETSHWHVCGECNDVFDKTDHTIKDEWIEDSAATCKAKAHHHKECSVCGYTMTDEDYGEFATHTWKEQLTADKQKECSVCGAKEAVYEEKDGKIYFGAYPQTREQNDGVVAELTRMSGNRPSKGNRGDWTDFGCYAGGEKDEYMWYIDIEYMGARYRGVYFTSYRPDDTTAQSGEDASKQDDHGYFVNTLYWFKWEPIEWRVLKKADGEAFLLSNMILDMQQYYHAKSGTRTIDGKTVYCNDYKESDIRAWLNDEFLNSAFDEFEQKLINSTLVDNSAKTSDNESSLKFDCADTQDKVFLLSYRDVLNADYGFSTKTSSDSARQFTATDYALAQGGVVPIDSGIYDGFGWGLLRSPCTSSSEAWANSAWGVSERGKVASDSVNALHGVAPALKISL